MTDTLSAENYYKQFKRRCNELIRLLNNVESDGKQKIVSEQEAAGKGKRCGTVSENGKQINQYTIVPILDRIPDIELFSNQLRSLYDETLRQDIDRSDKVRIANDLDGLFQKLDNLADSLRRLDKNGLKNKAGTDFLFNKLVKILDDNKGILIEHRNIVEQYAKLPPENVATERPLGQVVSANNLSQIDNHPAFFQSIYLLVSDLVNDHRQAFEKKAAEYGRLKAEYDIKIVEYLNSTKPKDGWIERTVYVETEEKTKDGIWKGSEPKQIYVPAHFPDNPFDWFGIYDSTHYHELVRYLFPNQARWADTTLRSFIIVSVIYNYLLPEPDKHAKSIDSELLEYIPIETELSADDERTCGQKIRNRIIEAFKEVRRELEQPDQQDREIIPEDEVILKEPSKQDCQIYLCLTTTGPSQSVVASKFFPKMKPTSGQSKVSRAKTKVQKWLEACGLPTEQALGRIKEIVIDPNKIDLGERTDGKKHGDPRTNRLNDEDDQWED